MDDEDVLRGLLFVFIIVPLLVFVLPFLFFMGEMWFLFNFILPLHLPPLFNFIILLSVFVAAGVFFLKMLDLIPGSPSSSTDTSEWHLNWEPRYAAEELYYRFEREMEDRLERWYDEKRYYDEHEQQPA